MKVFEANKMELVNTSNELAILTKNQLIELIAQSISQAKAESDKPQEAEKVFLTSKELQEFLNIKHSTMHRLINQGKLKPKRLGRKLLFDKSEVIETVKRNR